MTREVKSVLIIGYGVMGRGIAITFVRGGHRVAVLSRDPSKAEDVPAGVSIIGALPDQAPDLIIESIPEDLPLKIDLLEQLEERYGDGPIIATNTSSLPMEAMAESMANPGRFIGMHYFQPPEALPCDSMNCLNSVRSENSGASSSCSSEIRWADRVHSCSSCWRPSLPEPFLASTAIVM